MKEQVTIFILKYFFFTFYIKPCQISVTRFFQMIISSTLTKSIGPTRKTIIDMQFLLRNILFDFLATVGLVLQLKRGNLGYQDLLDKSLWWFLGFQYMEFGVNTKYVFGLPSATQIGLEHEERKKPRTMTTTNPLH